MLSTAAAPVKKLGVIVRDSKVGVFLGTLKRILLDLIPVSPQKRLVFQGTALALSVVLITSFSAVGIFVSAPTVMASDDYITEYNFGGDILIDEEGYLVKANPQTDQSSRIGLTDFAVHTVESGETLSVIAERYGISTETIMWENNIVNANSLRTGQKLLIPPVTGVSYVVQNGDTLSKVSEKYKISSESIIAQNNLESESLVKGQRIFLPGAKSISQPSTVASSRNYTATRSTRSYDGVEDSTAAPVGERPFIYPTMGKVTQGYRAGHYAVDIADSSMPPVWAAGGGTVIKVSTGTWGGGYGNHVIIDHGNGLKTLYAHLDSVNVTDGQWVNQGDVIGIMGNTGRVYGRTGIHLHFEVMQDGVKVYPANYY